MVFDFHRGRRLRRTAVIRDIVRETSLSPADLMMPYFVVETDDQNFKKPISSMPGQFQLSLKQLELQVREAVENGLKSLILFGIPAEKDPVGSQAYAEEGIVQQAVKMIKGIWPDLVVCTDVCLCEFTSHGHCGLIKDGRILNDPTLDLLARTALSHAKAGADIVAPSDMMDGRVAAIRELLDESGFEELPIMSYAVKYASAYYGPFREAAESSPQFGDRKTYQMDPANAREGLREASADVIEGADILMVKPAGPYQDVIRMVRDSFDLPVAAYQVSGEYSMIKAAGINGWIDEKAVVLESLIGLKRAGADLILTYFTEDVLKYMGNK
ncbi:porphobilinogen synthase [Maridesulfovibrio ferrireducens]|uniref:Delta-aminolevulinic acid dehydratase n=1 Tax=Maridesulfovibrio ferrireducens TaxID=246191 RepID=A0A1G9F3N3_9BACT|nr:porphobilinogen synthase [Maridesulfovibrio ferrireducens]SDK82996.1 porphobilinogen synthase [Maridesulfovibrio ferrireducens]